MTLKYYIFGDTLATFITPDKIKDVSHINRKNQLGQVCRIKGPI